MTDPAPGFSEAYTPAPYTAYSAAPTPAPAKAGALAALARVPAFAAGHPYLMLALVAVLTALVIYMFARERGWIKPRSDDSDGGRSDRDRSDRGRRRPRQREVDTGNLDAALDDVDSVNGDD